MTYKHGTHYHRGAIFAFLAVMAIVVAFLATDDAGASPAAIDIDTSVFEVKVAKTTAVPTHTQEWAEAQCMWNEATQYGLNPNGVTYFNCVPMHGWGSHQAHVHISGVTTPLTFCRIIDIRGFWHSYDC